MAAAAKKTKPSGPQLSIAQALIQLTHRGPLHIILIGLALIWLTPTLGLGITSFRSRGDIASSGWWTTVSGQRSSTAVALELSVDADSTGRGIRVSAVESDLLRGATEGFPAAAIGQVDIIEVRGELHIDSIDDALNMPGIGNLTVTGSATAEFEPAAGFSSYFIIEEVLAGEAGAIVSYRLTGRQALDGVIAVDDINDGKRIPRTGTLTVLEDGSYTFERRSSFVGTFEATIADDALAQRPIPVHYSVVQSGGVLQSFPADKTADIPLAGKLSVSADGSYSFEPLPDFVGTLVSEVSRLNLILTADNYRGVLQRPDLPPPGFADNLRNSLIVTIPSTIFPILLASAGGIRLRLDGIPPARHHLPGDHRPVGHPAANDLGARSEISQYPGHQRRIRWHLAHPFLLRPALFDLPALQLLPRFAARSLRGPPASMAPANFSSSSASSYHCPCPPLPRSPSFNSSGSGMI